MRYQVSHLEEYIEELYKKLGIYHPHQLTLENIIRQLGMQVFYLPHKSTYINGVFFLDNRTSSRRRWQSFGHELCHALLHAGDQLNMPPPFREYQEWKASNFTLYACAPSHMLVGMDLLSDYQSAISLIQDTFNVERDFAKRRLDKWHQQIEGHLLSKGLTKGVM